MFWPMPHNALSYQEIALNVQRYHEMPLNALSYQDTPLNAQSYQEIPLTVKSYQEMITDVYTDSLYGQYLTLTNIRSLAILTCSFMSLALSQCQPLPPIKITLDSPHPRGL